MTSFSISTKTLDASCLLASLFLLAASQGCGAEVATTNIDRALVVPFPAAASVPPLAYLLEQIAGDRAQVVSAIPSTTTAESYHPTVHQIELLSRARLVLRIGERSNRARPPIEARLDPIWDRNRDVVTVIMPIDDGAAEPHPWLAPAIMLETAERLAAALAALDPEGSELYSQRLGAFRALVANLDRELRDLFHSRPGMAFFVVHPAWTSFATEYGLEQVALEVDGKEPSPRRVVELVDQAREKGARTIFVQSGFSNASARAIASEIGADLTAIDPLAFDWPRNLLETARLVARSTLANSEAHG